MITAYIYSKARSGNRKFENEYTFCRCKHKLTYKYTLGVIFCVMTVLFGVGFAFEHARESESCRNKNRLSRLWIDTDILLSYFSLFRIYVEYSKLDLLIH